MSDAELSRHALYQLRQRQLSGVPSYGDPFSARGYHQPQPQLANLYEYAYHGVDPTPYTAPCNPKQP
jgi:hypothetical protein